jgi:ubiquitin C-terminal hydrolase
MEWNVLTQHGLGLHNHGHAKHQQNKCYLNAIIQCLANTAPFAQWLLCEAEDNQCTHII